MEVIYVKHLSQLLLTNFYGSTKQLAVFFDLQKLPGNPFMKGLQIRLTEDGLEKFVFITYHKHSMRQYLEVSNYQESEVYNRL